MWLGLWLASGCATSLKTDASTGRLDPGDHNDDFGKASLVITHWKNQLCKLPESGRDEMRFYAGPHTA